MNRKGWSYKEDRRLSELAGPGKILEQIAKVMDRTPDGIRNRSIRRTQDEHMFSRFALELGHCPTPSACLKRAKNRLMRCSKQASSITWSARSNMEVGIVRMSTARLQGHHKM